VLEGGRTEFRIGVHSQHKDTRLEARSVLIVSVGMHEKDNSIYLFLQGTDDFCISEHTPDFHSPVTLPRLIHVIRHLLDTKSAIYWTALRRPELIHAAMQLAAQAASCFKSDVLVVNSLKK
jgi:hypothetical protein